MTAGDPSEEPIAGKPHDGICGGESQQWLSYPTKCFECPARVNGWETQVLVRHAAGHGVT